MLEVRNLRTYFYTRHGVVKAVDGVDLAVGTTETLGLVGESGCGKSVTVLSILRLVPPPGRIEGGQILFEGVDLVKRSEREMRRIRGSKISIVLQDPLTSLNPVYTIGDQVTEAITTHQHLRGKAALREAVNALTLVRIPEPEMRTGDFPHQLSGGMRQRVVGAIAMSCQPRLLIADEPTTSLDVTIQAQYLDLLKQIQQRTGISIIFVTHDLGIVARMCNHVAVMYAGRVVEVGPVRDIFNNPRHPYTIGLLSCLPRMESTARLVAVEGEPPDLSKLPPGCRFAPRCGRKKSICDDRYPPETVFNEHHKVSCWLEG